MKATIARRLIWLEAQQHGGCTTCQWWDGTLIEDDTGAQSRPDQCPDCGKVVPVHCVLHLHGVNWDDL
jgi:hypothetical protein